jgi:Tfp pilus assembly protein FimT
LKLGTEFRTFATYTNAKGTRLSTGSLRKTKTVSSCNAGGFSLLELTIALGLTFGFAGLSLSDYSERTSTRRAAQVFALDLTLARSTAMRTQEAVVIQFFESGRRYVIETQSGSVVVTTRRFGDNADIDLETIDLDITGDSLVFSARGIADLSGASGALGTATFSSGATGYTVSFNSRGASKVEPT